MALPTYALGRNEKLFVVAESVYGTPAAAPAAGNAIKFRGAQFAMSVERTYRDDRRTTRSWLETIQRRKTASWSVEGYLLPSGAAGTAPDGWDDVLTAAFGTQTINASTSVVYTLAKEFQNSLTFHRGNGTSAATAVFGETITGAVVNEVTFDLSAQDEAKVSVKGDAVEILRAGATLAVSDTGTVVTVTSGDGNQFDAGVYIDAGAVTAQLVASTAANTVTIPAHAAVSGGALVVPSACTVAQTFTATAKPVSGILGSCTLESVALDIISAQINLSNGNVMHNDKFGTDKVDSFHRGNRTVSGSINLRLSTANFIAIAKTRRNTAIALTLVTGTTAGSIATFTFPAVIVDYAAIPVSAAEDTMISLPFKAYGSSGEDEITLTLT